MKTVLGNDANGYDNVSKAVHDACVEGSVFILCIFKLKKKKASLERGRNSQGGKQMKMEPDAFSQELGFSTPLGLHRLLALSLFAPWSE